MTPLDILLQGVLALQDYLSAHVLTCLIPAFFIAGAIAVFVSKQAVLKYFGPTTRKYISYPVASVSGTLLAVCSCTCLPLFAGIYKRGAGIGPATAFLFSGPAINILAIVLTAQVLGYEIGLARAVAAISMSIVIGLLMAVIFRKSQTMALPTTEEASLPIPEVQSRPRKITITFFLSLVLILVIGAASTAYIPLELKFVAVYLLTILVAALLVYYYDREEITHWGQETWELTKKIFPILLLGVFVVGIISGVAAYLLPHADPSTALGILVKPYIGSNTLLSCFLASVIGAVLYMPTLLEVPIVGTLFGYSSGVMGGGPALSLLLAGPSLSLPCMIVLTRIIGMKKTAVYVGLVVGLSTLIGLTYGVIIG